MRSVIGGSVIGYRTVIATPIEELIDGLTADGVFAKLDRLWVFAQPTQAEALVDLVASATATAVNSPTFAAYLGYTGDGSTSYIDSNFNPATAGGNYTQNSACIGLWAITTGTGSSQQRQGWHDTGPVTLTALNVHYFGGAEIRGQINSAVGSTISSATATKLGLITRTGANAATLYSDGASVGTDNTTASTVITDAVNIFFGATNGDGTPGSFSDEQMACAVIGGGLNSTDASNLWTRLRTYMTAVGVP
jgi:hypothetical protein